MCVPPYFRAAGAPAAGAPTLSRVGRKDSFRWMISVSSSGFDVISIAVSFVICRSNYKLASDWLKVCIPDFS